MGRGLYSAAESGGEGFSEGPAIETKPFGVPVTIVAPGGFRTDSRARPRASSHPRRDVGGRARLRPDGPLPPPRPRLRTPASHPGRLAPRRLQRPTLAQGCRFHSSP
ncbi:MULTISPECIES: hypothetical protein [Methylobacterium]|uniref:hypothetical protein n=1 Tax=Methylobacterium TaxID=407 RepID=UPI001EE292EA|nr:MULTISPECIES: hypothetical protein [Methylobacterium]